VGQPAFASFETCIGACGIAWQDGLIIGTALPETSAERLFLRLSRRFEGARHDAMPLFVQEAAALVTAMLSGQGSGFPLNLLNRSRSDPFENRVYDATLAIPRGETRTYGEVAALLGAPGAARAVGGALGRNPFPIIVPCHRILPAGGGSGGFSAPGGTHTKMKLLELEGARRGAPGLFDHLPWQMREA
jgi:methylated-DNA-[protein]-cysteine S-methyltransferase